MIVNTSISENEIIYVCNSIYLKELNDIISYSMKTNTGRR